MSADVWAEAIRWKMKVWLAIFGVMCDTVGDSLFFEFAENTCKQDEAVLVMSVGPVLGFLGLGIGKIAVTLRCLITSPVS